MGLTAYETTDLVINGIIGVGTVAALALTLYLYLDEKKSRSLDRRALMAQSVVIPALRAVREIAEVLQASSDPFRPALSAGAQELGELCLEHTHVGHPPLASLLRDVEAFGNDAHGLAKELHRLQLKQNSVMDELGSALSGDHNRKEWPSVVAKSASGKNLAVLKGNSLTEMWLREWDFPELLASIVDDYHGEPFALHVSHGQAEIKQANARDVVRITLDSVMSQRAEVMGLRNRFKRLQNEATTLEKKLRSYLATERREFSKM